MARSEAAIAPAPEAPGTATLGKILERRPVFRGRVVDLAIERVELPNGETCELELIRHPGAAAVLPVTASGEVILVRQYRHATGGWLLEVPAGKLDLGEPPDACARREVAEEVGWRPGRLESLGWIWSSPGFADERIWLFEATELEPAVQSLEADEVLHVERLPLAEAVAQASDGRIVDCKTVCCLLRAHLRRLGAAGALAATLLLAQPTFGQGPGGQGAAPAQIPSQLSLTRPADLLQPPPDAERSPSGLVSKVLGRGTGTEHPDDNDMVSVHFAGWTPEGRLFANSVERGQPAVFDVAQLFPGFREGVSKMVAGEIRRLWIPAQLAPAKPGQGPSGAVVIDVELLALVRLPPAPEDLLRRPTDAERTASGVFSKVLAKGSGSAKPAPADKVLVIYTGWTRDGRIFDSSLKRFRPTMFLLETVMPAFAEGVRQMVEGERRRLWIPAAQANRQWPGSPEGDLVFDVELLQIVK